MTLFDIISQSGRSSDSTSDDEVDGLPLTIYAARVNGQWTHNSPAVVAAVESGGLSQAFNGILMEYVLEVYLAREIVDDWLNIAGKARVSDAERFFVVTHYAEHDCWPDPSEADVYPQEPGAVRANLPPPPRVFMVGVDGATHQTPENPSDAPS